MPLEHALQRRGRFPNSGPWKMSSARPARLDRPLGLEHYLPLQHHRKTKRVPFQLNIMVVGESGLGKSTFINTIFCSDLKDTSVVKETAKTVEVTPTYFELEEDGIRLHLCLVDTPGFGDRMDRSEDLQPILDYIDRQYAAYYEAENHTGFRPDIRDTRIHACLYFIAPTGHCLKELDIAALKALSAKINVIPVIAKGDTMTPEEKIQFKQAILKDLEDYQIHVYPSAYPDEDRDARVAGVAHVPFAVMGSNTIIELPNGKKVRGREYRWGTVEVDNPEHCDVPHLRELLIIHCLHDLVEITHQHHYFEYRTRLLRKQGRRESLLRCDEGYEEILEEHHAKIAKEMTEREEEIRRQFVEMVKEKEDELRKREAELQELRDRLTRELEEAQRHNAQLEQELAAKLKIK